MTVPRSHRHLLVRGGTVVTMDPARRILAADLLVTEGRIVAVGPDLQAPGSARLIDARGLHVFPGFIQGHVHLGQTLFRGLAEDRELLDWLAERIWPLEAAHTGESAYASTLLGAVECLLSGTTTVQDIGLVRGMGGVFRGLVDSGLRAVAGKCLMDTGDGVPSALREETGTAIAGAEALAREWDGAARGRITAAVCPRFVLSGSRELWEQAADLSRRLDRPVHTHLLETAAEEAAVREEEGMGQLEFLDRVGILDRPLSVAHGVRFGPEHLGTLGGRPLGIVHCPSANAKLGSGIADLVFQGSVAHLARGLGTDGAACNNTLNILEEMRLAARLQTLHQGPGRFRAEEALEMATIEGARAIGKESELGSLEPGKCGDLVILDLARPGTVTVGEISPAVRVVHGAGRSTVRWVVVDGEILVEDGKLPHLDIDRVIRRALEEAEALAARAALS